LRFFVQFNLLTWFNNFFTFAPELYERLKNVMCFSVDNLPIMRQLIFNNRIEDYKLITLKNENHS
jgi:hypothetical protein